MPKAAGPTCLLICGLPPLSAQHTAGMNYTQAIFNWSDTDLLNFKVPWGSEGDRHGARASKATWAVFIHCRTVL